MNFNHALNSIIDFFYEKKREKKTWEPLTNWGIINGLKNGKLFFMCLVSRNNNPVSQGISDLSGPFSHFVPICDMLKYYISKEDADRLVEKLEQYYGSWDGNASNDKYLVLASADDNGMNYFDLSEYQNREMVIFDLTASIPDEIMDDIIKDFLSPEVMNENYDYTWIFGQALKYILLWIGRKIKPLEKITTRLAIKTIVFFDDRMAFGCSEEEEIFRKHGVILSECPEPSPTDIYNYCRDRYPIAYSNLKKEY